MEHLVGKLFEKKGYKVRVTQKTAFGISIAVIGFFAIGHYFVLDSFAQGSEESLGSAIEYAASVVIADGIIFGIPALVILLIFLKIKGRLTMSLFKKITIGTGLFFLVAIVFGIGAGFLLLEEEKTQLETERQNEITQAKLENAKNTLEEQKKYQEIQRLGDESFADAKKILGTYLESLKKGVTECNKVPNSVKISSLVSEDAEEIVVNSVLMILIIEEVEKKGYDGLSPYKQEITTSVDELTQCLNRH
jgi:hypothetical protein